MGGYYNPSRTSVSVTLATGRMIAVPSKSWVEVSGGEDICADVATKVATGVLVPSPLNQSPEIAPATTVTPPEQAPVEAVPAPAPAIEEPEVKEIAPTTPAPENRNKNRRR